MADTSPPSAPPPGWYAESARAQRLRWWSGSEWTNHYQLVVQARTPAPPEELSTPLDEDIEDDADLLAVPRSAAQPGPQPATEAPPLTRAERAARERAASVATQMNPIVAVSTATMTDAAPAEDAPDSAESTSTDATPEPEPAVMTTPITARVFPDGASRPAEPVAQPALRDPAYPDQITTPDRPVRPLVYAPQSSRYTGGQPVIVDPSAGNGLASTSVALIAASAVCGVVAYFIRPSSEMVADVSSTLAAAFVVAAFILAVAGMAVAVQRPTRKGWAVVALVVSSLLLLGLIGLLALPLFTVAL